MMGRLNEELTSVDRLREEVRLREAAEKVDPVYSSVGSTFKKLLWAFESKVGISPPKYLLLHMLATEGSISQGQMSSLSGVDPSRVTQMAKGLEREGLIERARDRDDNRVVRMRMTSEGRRAFDAASERRKAVKDRIRRTLSREEEAELKRLLGKVVEALEEDEG
jgi:MarR family transcriptional regulator, organic hydroperoxide resistance regulator